jgi:hypothetical protein
MDEKTAFIQRTKDIFRIKISTILPINTTIALIISTSNKENENMDEMEDSTLAIAG